MIYRLSRGGKQVHYNVIHNCTNRTLAWTILYIFGNVLGYSRFLDMFIKYIKLIQIEYKRSRNSFFNYEYNKRSCKKNIHKDIPRIRNYMYKIHSKFSIKGTVSWDFCSYFILPKLIHMKPKIVIYVILSLHPV